MNLFYQRTYLVLGMFFVFVGVYSAYDAGTSYPTSTTITVVVVSIGFILGGIYLLKFAIPDASVLFPEPGAPDMRIPSACCSNLDINFSDS